MDLANWALNTTDRIFSTMRSGKGEPACPSRTDPVGYVIDSWSLWRPVCFSALEVEDVKDVYIFGYLVAVSLLFGLGGYLIYREIKKIWAAVRHLPRLQTQVDGLCRAVQTQTQSLLDLSRKLGPPPRWPKVLTAVLASLVLLVIAAGVFLGLVYKRMKKTEGFQVKIVKVTEGADSVVLPFESKKCRLKDVRVEWTRIQDKEVKVIVYERGHAQHQKKHKFFRRRTEMKKDPWTTGVANLTLRNLCFDDGGVYICTVYKDEKVLEKKVVVLLVKEGWLKTIKGLFQSGTENGDTSTAPGPPLLPQQLSSLQSLSDLPEASA